MFKCLYFFLYMWTHVHISIPTILPCYIKAGIPLKKRRFHVYGIQSLGLVNSPMDRQTARVKILEGAVAYQLGNTSSRAITQVKQ